METMKIVSSDVTTQGEFVVINSCDFDVAVHVAWVDVVSHGNNSGIINVNNSGITRVNNSGVIPTENPSTTGKPAVRGKRG